MVLSMLALAAATGGCSLYVQKVTEESIANTKDCVQKIKSSPEGQIVYVRLWNNDETDNADKLRDPKPLTKLEQDALVKTHNKMLQCRQMQIEHNNKYAPLTAPYMQEWYQRSDAIFFKLASAEISVGLANRLFIESNGKLQIDLAHSRVDAIHAEEAQRQRAAEILLQANAQTVASLPRQQITNTNCLWLGNSLNCTSTRQ